MEDKDQTYNFIGDSLIEYWPLDETFPSQIVYNFGKAGAGIKYLENFKGSFTGQDVVIMIGTNDSGIFYSDKIDDYIESYLQTISNLTDKTIYLFSILPREQKTDPADINTYIDLFNNKVKSLLKDYPNFQYIDVFNDFMYKDHINYQFFSDGLHLTIYGYEVLSAKLLDKIY